MRRNLLQVTRSTTPPFIPIKTGSGSDIRAATLVLSSVLEAPFYEALRTKRQLGYVVQAASRYREGVSSMVFLAQSAKNDEVSKGPLDLVRYIDEFLDTEAPSLLDKLDAAQLADIVDGLARRLDELPKALGGAVAPHVGRDRVEEVRLGPAGPRRRRRSFILTACQRRRLAERGGALSADGAESGASSETRKKLAEPSGVANQSASWESESRGMSSCVGDVERAHLVLQRAKFEPVVPPRDHRTHVGRLAQVDHQPRRREALADLVRHVRRVQVAVDGEVAVAAEEGRGRVGRVHGSVSGKVCAGLLARGAGETLAAGALFGGEAVPPGPGGSVARLKVFVRVSASHLPGGQTVASAVRANSWRSRC